VNVVTPSTLTTGALGGVVSAAADATGAVPPASVPANCCTLGEAWPPCGATARFTAVVEAV
jgi:hypothetical protein